MAIPRRAARATRVRPVAPRGTLFLIVGPSGAGKDSLLRAAQTDLESDGDFVFARRTITRPLESHREDHEPVSPEDFLKRAERGKFMLSWRVYDTDYGISIAYEDELAAGRNVIANVSRTVVAAGFAYFSPTKVIQVTAPREVLESRLRKRADPATAAARLARAVVLPDGVPVTHLLNAGDIHTGSARLVRLLTKD
ncbi:MAG: phosphonate metabolism protein/1,5-bisphosphokinase (PRPP-forming) PhnN [Rhodospirillaceae bacterium]|jgi:phosphonate metabolism protein PhnN/1,5-bisphosphokinase (PRPP-forming)|nr:phosphonate metabolism protein/1,5-bisphosphokinase (PRPP-forming) PhnN [Rhodospirillaceae bacterium]MBT5049751.1 phosphonate metabolism protein/1,5-bisphosphokinase (PRPP-forming) PhnN [Rhodospirillaceae bacterium]